jgi:transposase
LTEEKDVLTVDDYGAIRRAHRDGMSIRQIARDFGHSRRKIRQVLTDSQPSPYTRTQPPPAPILGPFHSIINQILESDELAPPKQRHSAMQLFRRLRDEHGYRGGYAQVQRYLLRHRRSHRETFIPLAHPPGRRLEADFAHIYVDFPDGRKPIPVLVTVWAYSHYPFVMALPTERTEAILAGMVAAFEFFACAAREVWWDNPRSVVSLISRGRDRQLHPRYAALASHYAFDPRFCLPAHAHEKPDAESTVKAVQRRFATPVPCVADLGELNGRFRALCQAELGRTVQSLTGPFRIGDRFAEDRAAAGDLPRRGFDPCIESPAVVADKYQTVAFDGNRYSVPRPYAFQTVTVKGYIDRVVMTSRGQVIASHPRCYRRSELVLDPAHYLVTLARRPAALDCAPVFRDWRLPASFAELRVALEGRHGPLAGSRQFVRVLQLLAEHPARRVAHAIELCKIEHVIEVEVIVQRTRSLAAEEAGRSAPAASPEVMTGIPGIQVPRPDLSRFDRFLGGCGDEVPPAPGTGPRFDLNTLIDT